jgi:hypothetical protein
MTSLQLHPIKLTFDMSDCDTREGFNCGNTHVTLMDVTRVSQSTVPETISTSPNGTPVSLLVSFSCHSGTRLRSPCDVARHVVLWRNNATRMRPDIIVFFWLLLGQLLRKITCACQQRGLFKPVGSAEGPSATERRGINCSHHLDPQQSACLLLQSFDALPYSSACRDVHLRTCIQI